jgi:transposase
MLTPNILRQNYTLFSRPYQLKLPLEIGHTIPDNDCVRLLGQFVEELDLSDLYSTYSRVKENQVSPRQMLKIMLYAYHEHNYSSRGIEKACRRDINYMYLLEGRSAPDHATIARFRSIHFGQVADKYLAMTARYLMDLGEISGREIFIDGTKIEANANKYTFVWKKSVTKNQVKLLEKTALLVQECVESYGLREIWHGQVKEKHLSKILRKLYKIKDEESIEFVHGSGCRKTQLQKHIELLEEYSARLKEYSRKLEVLGDRNSYSKTDPDATFMRMKEDAMLNGQLKPAYNLQLGVDSGYISWLTLSPKPTDTSTLIPFLTGMETALKHRYPVVVADAGYESEENYSYLEDRGISAMIKPANYEISKTRKYKQDISRRENMPYNPDGDYYTCRNGCRLYAHGIHHQKTASGYVRKQTVYRCYECAGCPHRAECLKGKNWKIPEEERFKKLTVSRKFERQRKECLDRITSEEGIQLRVNRSIQAEGAFALWKEDGAFRQFLCRGQANVYAESVLMAIAQNLDNLHRRIQNRKLGLHLYEV